MSNNLITSHINTRILHLHIENRHNEVLNSPKCIIVEVGFEHIQNLVWYNKLNDGKSRWLIFSKNTTSLSYIYGLYIRMDSHILLAILDCFSLYKFYSLYAYGSERILNISYVGYYTKGDFFMKQEISMYENRKNMSGATIVTNIGVTKM